MSVTNTSIDTRAGDLATVRWWTAVKLCSEMISSELVTRGRMVFWGALCSVLTIVAWVYGRNAASLTDEDKLQRVADYIDVGVLVFALPMACLFFAVNSLGNLRDDKTLVYLTLRPIRNSSIVAGAIFATVSVVFPVIFVPVVAGGLMITSLTDGFLYVMIAGSISSLGGMLAYVSLFVWLGIFVNRRAIAYGLMFITMWEYFVGLIGLFANKLTVTFYAKSLFQRVLVALAPQGEDSGISLVRCARCEPAPIWMSIVVLAGLVIVSITFTSVRLQNMEIP